MDLIYQWGNPTMLQNPSVVAPPEFTSEQINFIANMCANVCGEVIKEICVSTMQKSLNELLSAVHIYQSNVRQNAYQQLLPLVPVILEPKHDVNLDENADASA